MIVFGLYTTIQLHRHIYLSYTIYFLFLLYFFNYRILPSNCVFVNFCNSLFFYIFLFLGIHLQICPRGVTCCTPEMESKLWTLTRESFTSSLSSTTKPLQALFQTKSRLFSGNFYFFIFFPPEFFFKKFEVIYNLFFCKYIQSLFMFVP